MQDLTLHFLKKGHIKRIKQIGETILGVPAKELDDLYIQEFDRYVSILEDYLQKDVKTLLWMVNSRMLSLLFVRRLRKFESLDSIKRETFLRKMSQSRISLLRTSFVTLRALVSWSYYNSVDLGKEMDYPGETIGREHLTPTLLFGKSPWDETILEEST